MTVEMVEVWVNDRWPLLLPKHRADRVDWPYWEAARLASMWHELGEASAANCYTETTGRSFRANTFSPNGQVVYDIGAEEGDFPALWSSWGCDVVLFEPNDRVWPNIKAIWEANDLRPPLATWPGFAGPIDDGWCNTVVSAKYHGLRHLEFPPSADGPVIGDHGFLNLSERPDVPSITIDHMAQWAKPPTAITIDVEGAEYEVLLGAQNTLREHRPFVWVSVHPEFACAMYGHKNVREDIKALMLDCGYPLDPESGQSGVHLATDHEEHWLWRPGR